LQSSNIVRLTRGVVGLPIVLPKMPAALRLELQT